MRSFFILLFTYFLITSCATPMVFYSEGECQPTRDPAGIICPKK